jgi:hypothetical protein
VRPDAEQVGTQYQAPAMQEVGEPERARLQRDPVGLPVVAGRVTDHRLRGRPGQQHTGLLERLPYCGRHVRRGRVGRATQSLPEPLR